MESSTSTTLSVGQRLELRRRRKGLSRKVVANLVGRSEEWLRLVESGRRELAGVEVLGRLAEVLQVEDPTELIDWPVYRSSIRHHPNIDLHAALNALRQAIVEHPMLQRHNTDSDEFHEIEILTSNLRECSRIWTTARQRYSRLAEILPTVVTAAQALHWRLQDIATAELLVESYYLTRALLTAWGDHALAAIVADRSMSIAAFTRQPSLLFASAWHVAVGLLHAQRPAECHDYALTAAHRIPELMLSTADAMVLSGSLHLLAAHAAADCGNLTEGARLLGAARRLTDEVAEDNHVRGIAFGPIEVGITTMEIALAQHDPDQVVRLAASIELSGEQTLERQVTYHLCQAKAYVLRRDDVAATLALMKTAALSPEDLRYHPDAHYCLQYLVRCGNYLTRSEVGQLVKLAGIPT